MSDLVERVARIVSPETWKCADAWDDPPPSVKAGRQSSMERATDILKLVGPNAKPAQLLAKMPTYIEGALDTFEVPDNLRTVLLSWSDECAATLNRSHGDAGLPSAPVPSSPAAAT